MSLRSRVAGVNATIGIAGRLPDVLPTVVMYHSVGVDGGYDNVSTAEFGEQIAWLNARYDVVDLADVLDEPTDGSKKVAITFDDGLASFYENARPVLREQSTPATVFALAAAVDPTASASRETIVDERLRTPERLMSRAELADLAESSLFTIGAHTGSHPLLPDVDDPARLAEEVVESKGTLESSLDVDVDRFAYPGNRWDDRSRDLVRDTYDYAVWGSGLTTPITPDTPAHLLPRISGGVSTTELQLHVTDAGKRMARLYRNLVRGDRP